MKLQILIPRHNEPWSVIKNLLDSIALQQSVNFHEVGVIICDDGSTDTLSGEFNYPFTVDYHYRKENKGVSFTRQECLNKAKATYVMFCDADDMFHNACGLWIVFREIEDNGGFDSLVSAFVEESQHPETKEHVFINHDMDSTFVHGKVHRRKHLKKKNIRWNPDLRIHEDSYFNILCQNLSENVKYCPTPFYLWKWRDESVCRHDPKYILKTYQDMLKSNDALIDEFTRRGMSDKAMFYAVMMIWDTYYTFNKPEWVSQENQEYRDITERRFAAYYRKHKSKWETMPMQDKMAISNGVRQRSVAEGMLVEAVTITDWLKKVEEM